MSGSLDLCAVCWKAGVKLCSKCKNCGYCSKECQREDWKSHKKVCKVAADAKAGAQRPSPNHISAIYCPENKDTYEFVWVKCIPNLSHPGGPRFIPTNESIRAIFGREQSGIKITGHFWGPGLPGVIYPHQTATFYPTDMKPGNDRPLLIVGCVNEFGLLGALPRFVDATLADFRIVHRRVSPLTFALHWPECPAGLGGI